jgi:hypothetical protein
MIFIILKISEDEEVDIGVLWLMWEVMDADTASTTTSIDDKTEDFCENPTRDILAEGLMCLLKPTIDQLDERVRATR